MSDNSSNMEWNNFSEQSPDRDSGLRVENSIFWVSRRDLADCSPVFDVMLYGEFRESKEEIVKLSEKEPEEILELLRCLFPCDQNGEKKPIDDENLEMLLSLADEYQITDLLDRCWEFVKMKMQESSIEFSMEYLVLAAHRYKMKEVVRAGLRRLSEFKKEDLLANQAFESAPRNIQRSVLIVQRLRSSRPQNLSFFDRNLDYYCVICGWLCGIDPNDPNGKCPICFECGLGLQPTEAVLVANLCNDD